MPNGPRKRTRPWQEIDTRRLTPTERGYDAGWTAASALYRRQHPTCVLCELKGKVSPSECVDHIIPIHCCPELKMEAENWAALCWTCHSYKTTKEPREKWLPNRGRVVVCGVPGTGKSTWAHAQSVPVFDADELGLSGWEQIIPARSAWIGEQSGPCIVIVASTLTAALVARELRGVVRHLTERHIDRKCRYGS
ncbi:HNH endonuclease [Lacipirellula sp.]|uniref:HNH endonuclease n=1 Tax=Lacipirellula sp. TaxID=2691419 RepID=UPI003D101320